MKRSIAVLAAVALLLIGGALYSPTTEVTADVPSISMDFTFDPLSLCDDPEVKNSMNTRGCDDPYYEEEGGEWGGTLWICQKVGETWGPIGLFGPYFGEDQEMVEGLLYEMGDCEGTNDEPPYCNCAQWTNQTEDGA